MFEMASKSSIRQIKALKNEYVIHMLYKSISILFCISARKQKQKRRLIAEPKYHFPGGDFSKKDNVE